MDNLWSPYEAASKTEQGPSNEAGKIIRPKVKDLKSRVLAAIASVPSGLTPDEVADRLDLPLWSVRPRCSELVAGGHIEDTGVRRRNKSGAKATVYRVKQEA
jgi:predicted transcriptional regulator